MHACASFACYAWARSDEGTSEVCGGGLARSVVWTDSAEQGSFAWPSHLSLYTYRREKLCERQEGAAAVRLWPGQWGSVGIGQGSLHYVVPSAGATCPIDSFYEDANL